ncbi:MAG: hypothetical protein DMG40_13045 [Acidobacteria bacterium]|nr:MAG: hypothetical protein DMG40_13045 [Acidobacteriota bacterium]
MKLYTCACAFFLLALAAPARAQNALLPNQLAGWQASGPAIPVKPSDLGPQWDRWQEGEQILAESGLGKIVDRPYKKGDDQLGLRLYQFKDPSGAYEFYTFAVVPGMQPLGVGEDSAIRQDDARMLLGNLVIQAGLSDHLSPTVLQDIAAGVKPHADQTPLPAIRNYLPAEGQVFGSEKYALGPQGFLSAAKFLDRPEIAGLVNEVGFERDDAEAMFAQYHSGKGEAVLLLIEYPTPQLAEQHLHHFEADLPSASRQAGTTVAREGSLLSVVLKPSSAAFAESLRNAIRYHTEVTWNEPTHKLTDPPWLLIVGRIFIMTLLFMGLAVAVGAAFGGVRVLLKMIFPGKIFDRPDQMEVLQLGLSGSKRIDSRDFY